MSTGSRLAALREAVRIRGALHRFGLRVLAAHDTPEPAPDGVGARTLLIGPDPVRILVYGAGAAIGYGTTDRRRALDGHLAALVQAATGRGVVVENRARPHHDGPQVLRETAGTAGAHTFGVVVYAPDYLPIAEHVSARAWTLMFDRVSAGHGSEGTPLVMVPYPLVTGRHLHAALVRAQVARANRAMARTAAARGHRVALQTAIALRDPGEPMFDSAYYEATARATAAAVLTALGIAATEPVG